MVDISVELIDRNGKVCAVYKTLPTAVLINIVVHLPALFICGLPVTSDLEPPQSDTAVARTTWPFKLRVQTAEYICEMESRSSPRQYLATENLSTENLSIAAAA